MSRELISTSSYRSLLNHNYIRKRIFVDTVSTNKTYAVDTVSTNKSYAVDTVSTNKNYTVDTVSTNKNYTVDTLGAPCTKEHFALKVNFELKVYFVL